MCCMFVGDAVLEAEVWYRGCIHEDMVEGLQEEECVNLFYHPEVLDAVVPLELEVSIGGVCTCHDDKCNVHSDSDIDKVTRSEFLYPVDTRRGHNEGLTFVPPVPSIFVCYIFYNTLHISF